jgi:hypothetical protein
MNLGVSLKTSVGKMTTYKIRAATRRATPPKSIRFHFSEPGRSSATAVVVGIMNQARTAKGAMRIVYSLASDLS